jgi:hypothetical protein
VELKAWLILSAGIIVFYGVAIFSGNFPENKEIVEECRQLAVAMTSICP